MNYIIQRQQETYGPFPLEEVARLAKLGNLVPTDLAWAEGAANPTTVGALVQAIQTDATGGLIPYKNPPALTAYYLAVASLIPCVGILTGIPAFFLGLKGLKKARTEPWIKGQVHAWIGIILGGGMALLWLPGLVVLVLIPILQKR